VTCYGTLEPTRTACTTFAIAFEKFCYKVTININAIARQGLWNEKDIER